MKAPSNNKIEIWTLASCGGPAEPPESRAGAASPRSQRNFPLGKFVRWETRSWAARGRPSEITKTTLFDLSDLNREMRNKYEIILAKNNNNKKF